MAEGGTELSGVSSVRALIPCVMRTLPQDLITSQRPLLLTPAHWALGCPPMSLGGTHIQFLWSRWRQHRKAILKCPKVASQGLMWFLGPRRPDFPGSSDFSFHAIPASVRPMLSLTGSQSEEPSVICPQVFLLPLTVGGPQHPLILPFHSRSFIPLGGIKSLFFYPWLKQDLWSPQAS